MEKLQKNILKLLVKKLICVFRGVGALGPDVYISPLVQLRQPGRISLAEGVVLERYCRLYANGDKARIAIGRYSTVYPYALIKTNGGSVVLGAGCSLNDYSILYGAGGITIGDDVHIAAHVVVVASEHDYRKLGQDSFSSEVKRQGITIGNSVWIGANAVILDGVTIGGGTVIGAGSVVTKDIPPDSIAVGVPARVIKQRV